MSKSMAHVNGKDGPGQAKTYRTRNSKDDMPAAFEAIESDVSLVSTTPQSVWPPSAAENSGVLNASIGASSAYSGADAEIMSLRYVVIAL
mmetsp:Transcript_20916/g.37658  ORF Transcript_20916/g.37658 Transcript_20916/m.37658 type:complete len:90 (+) Transcript_20916:27-296(+)